MAIPRILLVDDRRDVIRLLHSSLETLGHDLEIIEVPSGEEAMLEASRHKIDLAVVDYRLPGISGLELKEKINAMHPEAKIILVTGITDKAIRKKVVEAGAFAFFEKPVPLGDFLDAVERALELKRTILPPEESSEKDTDRRKSLSDLLSASRKKMDALAVFIVSDRGRVLARAGDLPDSSMEVSLLSALMAIFAAGQKVSTFLHQEMPVSFHIFQGGDHDILLMPVNTSYAVVVAGDNLADRSTVMDVVSNLIILQSEVEHLLYKMGLSSHLPEEEPYRLREIEEEEEKPSEEEKEPSSDLDALFTGGKKKLDPSEVNSFWEDAVEKNGVAPLDPDKLSYQQARQLGLIPEEEET
jgi:CheY-like chemotaxis protein